ncbi:SEL1-like repeat protein [Leisingera sp. McT4-56]|uniref:SEL1-like repeat protein n=1 Tax=Leisingera sp. McT4-56 TaxID=2881255 RepID=UPI001CF8E877|nr:hypothetical protein [Leisingera sp. McT4-56]MCB4457277.1 hypothetical protein [Leisingera sp. McT4-56]
MTPRRSVLAGLWLSALLCGGAAAAEDGPWQAAPLAELQQAADAGGAAAQYALAVRLEEGSGILQSFTLAAEWLARAAAQGHAGAQNRLGQYYHEGLGVERDPETALRWLEQAAADGQPQYLFDLAAVLEQQPGGGARAAALYQRAAEAGHRDAAVSLGVLYQNGTGVAQDLERARRLYEGPAAAGHPRAQNNLGLMHVRGEGAVQDYGRAAELFRAAAAQGLRVAMGNLGVMYENGFGVAVDEARAAELYRQAGQGGAPGAAGQALPASVYDPRLLPPGTGPEELEQLRSGARAGDPVAQFMLAWLYLQPEPDTVPTPQLQEAARLLGASARAGYPAAMANLGLMYFEGRALPQDYVLGYMWLVLAGTAGFDAAPQLGAALSPRMTAAQIAEAQMMAAARAARNTAGN